MEYEYLTKLVVKNVTYNEVNCGCVKEETRLMCLILVVAERTRWVGYC